ncbi:MULTISPECIES: hypothetical protein [unclassified Actinomyces]|uniref:2'-5' RNA ligase family protein n=1 Tax=unclassified Actinomyces TaxID=2609248 RepID=UPI0013A6F1D0|nr:hypothetical protein [Actinomyces sp. 594]MBW3070355.1 hypothetical protein [Actinomyces sp. 594]NDR53084.1 hypothetical protein [Actinomyces sp. 565]
METLHGFDERVGEFQVNSVPGEPVFGLPASLEEKVTPRVGVLRPFYGDTIAYFLDDRVRELAGEIAHDLHGRFGESLSRPLPTEMAHVTLHDLHAGPDRAQVWPLVEADAGKAAELVARARAVGPIRTRCTTVFNLVNTSVVVGIRAADEDEHRKLLSARALFDEIVPSGPFTPHITLAYYRPTAPTPLAPGALRAALSEFTARVTGTPVMLAPERLHVLHFDSMGNYWPAQLLPLAPS